MTLDEVKTVRRNADLIFDREAVDAALDRMANDIAQTLANSNPVMRWPGTDQ